jgi:hypothetical protein
MAKNKKTKDQKRKERLRKAKAWVATYQGANIVGDYGKRYNVDSICAQKDLETMKAATPEQRQLLKQAHDTRREKEREEKIARLTKKLEKRKIEFDSTNATPKAMTAALKNARLGTVKKNPKRRFENCNRVMAQQFIGLKHCKCGTSWSKADGYFERTPDMVFALERKVTKKGKNSIRTKQVPVIRIRANED